MTKRLTVKQCPHCFQPVEVVQYSPLNKQLYDVRKFKILGLEVKVRR